MEFENKIAGFIKDQQLFANCKKVLLAVSGGADSVALAFVMNRLKGAAPVGVDIAVGHVNHGLRGPMADEDEAFTAGMAEQLGLETFSRTVNVKSFARQKKLSIETAARQLRREALVDMAKEGNCDAVATAHHKDDNAETVIHRIMRGTGIRGLCGIWPRKEFADGMVFVRLLMCVSRAEVIDYCRANRLSWQHDHTNDELAYTRNRIRHLLLPDVAKECSDEPAEWLAALSAECRKLYKRFCRQADKAQKKVAIEETSAKVVFDIAAFAQQINPVQAELIQRALVRIGCGQRNLSEYHYKQIMSLAKGTGGKEIQLPSGFGAKTEHGKIIFSPSAKTIRETGKPKEAIALEIGKPAEIGNWQIETTILEAKDCNIENFKAEKDSCVEWFDFDKLTPPIMVRKRTEGDRFQPMGKTNMVKIGKFITAGKIDYALREKLIVIEDAKRIIWLGPVRPGETGRITLGTKRILQIRLKSNS